MKLCIAPTDFDWFTFHAAARPDEVNFWRPGESGLTSLQPGELFLFKLKHPYNSIAGGGTFVRFTRLPLSLAWLAFGVKNGVPSAQELERKIRGYRQTTDADPVIGCIVLAAPFFLPERLHIPAAPFLDGIRLQGPKYINLDGQPGRLLWDHLQAALSTLQQQELMNSTAEEILRYGAPHLVVPRLGQGAFRVLVTDAYARRCSITGERTLPVLEAAHIKPYADDGPHLTSNGILLRSDLHILFDRGYITVTPEHKVEVSSRINQEFGNGKIYYALHGRDLQSVPELVSDHPGRSFLEWHNESKFRP